MATKKQRRRREKLQRHEYEYVVETEEGEEVVESPKAAKSTAGKGGPQGAIVDKRGRVIKPPSWSRVAKRGAIFGPILAILIFVLDRGRTTTASKIVTLAFMLALFLPFSYLMDRFLYRMVAKKQQNHGR
jgi:hypothetical protein